MRERQNNPNNTPIKSDIVPLRRSARLAEKREKVNEIGMLRRELKNLSVLQQKILHVAKRRERREEMSRDRRQASPELQRSSGGSVFF